jgi:ketosteroid isomerase-like protein
MKIMASACLFFLGLSMSSNAQADDFKSIEQLMFAQQDCWNSGDIECFMKTYWESDELRFVGKNGVTKGWQATFDNYKKKYPTKKAMGALTFDIKSNTAMGDGHVLTIGKWMLTFIDENAPVSGHFSLIWKKIDGQWKIIVDHTS